jgi:predicted XRE-type DNA-binding protein
MQQKIQELNAHLQQSELRQATLHSALSVQEHMVNSLLAKLTVATAPENTNALSPADPR